MSTGGAIPIRFCRSSLQMFTIGGGQVTSDNTSTPILQWFSERFARPSASSLWAYSCNHWDSLFCSSNLPLDYYPRFHIAGDWYRCSLVPHQVLFHIFYIIPKWSRLSICITAVSADIKESEHVAHQATSYWCVLFSVNHTGALVLRTVYKRVIFNLKLLMLLLVMESDSVDWSSTIGLVPSTYPDKGDSMVWWQWSTHCLVYLNWTEIRSNMRPPTM